AAPRDAQANGAGVRNRVWMAGTKPGHDAWTGGAALRKVPPMTNATKTRAKAAREARLREALRENLRRRKAQAGGRAQDEPGPEAAESTDSTATSDKPER